MITAVSLQTEYLTGPIGLDATAPLFTWKWETAGQVQTGCHVRVWLEDALVWDSGLVQTHQPRLTYAGLALESRKAYRWAVCLYSGEEQGSWSEEACFEMGLMKPEDWQARWIGMLTSDNYVVLCRHVRHLHKPVAASRAYLAAEGFARLWINGKCVCTDVLDPANTDYDKRILYRTFDITAYLSAGDNAFGVQLGRGWAPRAKCLLQVHVQYTDGTEEVICTQPGTWKIALSPIRTATLYGGEYYDARMECDDWNDPSDRFEKTHTPRPWGYFEYIEDPEKPEQRWWFPALEMPAPAGVLQAQTIEPVQPIGSFSAQKIHMAPDGSQVVDFGQNIAGWVRIRIHGRRGETVTLVHSELLHEDGRLNLEYLTSAAPHYPLPMQTDMYTFADDRPVEYEPQFTYHGFRYVAVKGLGYRLQPEDITAIVGCSALTHRSEFSCGNDLAEKIYRASVWSEKTNHHGIPTDCPQRAERQGWLNDMTARAEAAVYQFDMRRFYRKFIEDIRTAQDPVSGAIPDVAPFRHGNFPGDPVDCYLLLPYLLYWHYGDRAPMEQTYESMKKLTQYWERNTVEGILPFSLYGDWASPEAGCLEVFGKKTPVSAITTGTFVSTCFLYYYLTLMEQFASCTGREEEANAFRNRGVQIKEAIQKHFYDPTTGNFARGSQGANAMALYFGLVPAGEELKTVECLEADIRVRGCHLTTGNLGTKYVLEVLSMYDRVDLAFELLTQTTYPSWGFMMEHGATTIWERWEYMTGVDMNSHNHAMYGSIVAWMYKYLVGISPVEPGFRKVSIRPCMPALLPSAQASVDTAYGPIRCAWQQTETEVVTEVTVPLGVEAVMALPGKQPVVNGVPAENAVSQDGRWTFTCQGGTYRIVSPKK